MRLRVSIPLVSKPRRDQDSHPSLEWTDKQTNGQKDRQSNGWTVVRLNTKCQKLVFRQIVCYLAEQFRQIVRYLAELFRQIVCYLAELFLQIALPILKRFQMLKVFHMRARVAH